ncbi:YaaC family protein [Sorangium sp. So ce1000]|uniref:YaaC family protein n=1 Tax=Sorangium sp. So ce1000 TaxID=3133325 RepID=UPI003F5E5966
MKSDRPTYIRVYADSPTESMWTFFRRFETIDMTRRAFGDAMTNENATAARDCVRQAREYFASARSAPLLTKPVLLYYGMVSLAKLLFLFHMPSPYDMDYIESLERKGHGLKQHDSPIKNGYYELETGQLEVSADGGKSGMLIPRGIFPHLARIVNGSPVDNWLNKRIAIVDVLRSVPQLDAALRQTFGDAHGYSGLPAKTTTHSDGAVEIILSKSRTGIETADGFHARVPYMDPSQCSFYIPSGDTRYIVSDPVAIRFESTADCFRHLVREEFFREGNALPPAWLGHRLDSLLSSYMLMYALSIVARYKPHRWSHILEGRDSPMLPIIETSIMVCERWWPNLLLNKITGNWISFSQPSYG